MIHPGFSALLDATRSLHATQTALRGFADWPDDLIPQEILPFHVPAADVMLADQALRCPEDFRQVLQAVLAAASVAVWRETYKDTSIGDDFMRRFGCYCLIGDGGAVISGKMAAYVVYMPAGLDYPWHHHPAEEVYFILAGQAEFQIEGQPAHVVQPGDAVFHASNVAHATRTTDQPMLALVFWRGDLATGPVLTYPKVLA